MLIKEKYILKNDYDKNKGGFLEFYIEKKNELNTNLIFIVNFWEVD